MRIPFPVHVLIPLLLLCGVPLLLLCGVPAEGSPSAAPEPGAPAAADSAHRLRDEPRVELSAWLGDTRFRADEPAGRGAETGFRFGEFAFWANPKLRLWYQVDNGLSIDSFDLARANRRAPAHYLGGFLHYRGRYTTRLELGQRELPGGVGQRILRGEQVFFLPRARVVRLGGWLGPREDDRTEWILHGGLGLPVGDRLRLDPTFFYSRSGLPGERQWRALLAAEYSFESGLQAAAGAAGGEAQAGRNPQPVWEGYLKASVPVGLHRVHALVRREWIESRSTTVLAVGVTLGAGARR